MTVDKDVRLEVLDWGGSGTPIVLLAGGGNTAHVFDDFAQKLTGDLHVYGITRRGFGQSGFAASEDGADRLGDDVLAVLDSLKLKKPVLVGHSIGGEELSSVATRHPDRVAGVIYLDAGYPYAFDNGKGPAMSDFQGRNPQPPAPGEADLASFRAFTAWNARIMGVAIPEAEFRQGYESTPEGRVGKRRSPAPGAAAVMMGIKKYASIPVPALAVFAVPHDPGGWIKASSDPAVQETAKAFAVLESRLTERQAKVFEDGVPTARVVRLAGAHHYVFLSNEKDVLREMRAFLGGIR